MFALRPHRRKVKTFLRASGFAIAKQNRQAVLKQMRHFVDSLRESAQQQARRLLARIDWRQRAARDAIVIAVLAMVAWGLSEWLDLFVGIMKFQSIYGDWGLDDLAMMLTVLSFAFAAYAWRRHQDMASENRARRAAEAQVKQKIAQLTQAQTFLNTIVDNVPATIFVRELPECRFVLVNRQVEKLVGVSRDQILGRTVSDVFPGPAARNIQEHDQIQLSSHDPVLFPEVPVPTHSQGMRATVATGLAIRDAGGTPRYLVNVVQDITERKRAEAQIEHLAHHDPLTGLPNRAAFNAALEKIAANAGATGDSFAVLCMDLDRFKEINDVFGHAMGDALLCEIANRLQAACGEAFLARPGGDEFTAICARGPQPASAEALADNLLEALEGDVAVAGQTLRAGISIGVAVYPADGRDTESLLANADAALYRAKAEARGSIRFFEPQMDQHLRERRALQHDLSSALGRGELALYYQPQASIAGDVTGFEALVRWRHPARGLVPPGVFIPLAEDSGLIFALGEWILREACREAASWPKPLNIAVNFSPVQFRHGDLPALVHTILLETGLAASRLEIEITENVLIDDFARAVSVLRRLKALGVRIAMDDFGTGYSSLSYLQSFPFDKIKIDQAFVANLDRNQQAAAIIRAVIGLGHGLNLPVVAEGVETKEQLAFLTREECNEIQGYFIGRPAPIEGYAQLVGRQPAAAVRALAG
jgi:diguanylate cyclase (GGDEF)-like protein/PAS domain S-box-containing protein